MGGDPCGRGQAGGGHLLGCGEWNAEAAQGAAVVAAAVVVGVVVVAGAAPFLALDLRWTSRLLGRVW